MIDFLVKLVIQFHNTIELLVEFLSNTLKKAASQIDTTESGIINSHDILFPLNAAPQILVTHVPKSRLWIFAHWKASFPIVVTVFGITKSNGAVL